MPAGGSCPRRGLKRHRRRRMRGGGGGGGGGGLCVTIRNSWCMQASCVMAALQGYSKIDTTLYLHSPHTPL